MDSTLSTPTDTAIAEVEAQLSVLFSRVQGMWRDHAATVDPDLAPVGFKILGALVHGGPAHAGELADRLFTDKSVMSRQVRCMEGLGLVSSTADPIDGRARVIEATPKAIESFNAIRLTNQELVRDRLRQWPAEDIAKFADLISQLAT